MNDDWLSELEEYVQNYVTEDASLTESIDFNHFRQVFSYDRLVAEVKWLQEQVDQFQQDKKRLDWLEEYAFIQVPDFDHFNAALQHPFRTAIDKEM